VQGHFHLQEEKRCVLLQRAAHVLCLTVVLMLSACQRRAAPPTPIARIACGGHFEATVRQGPSAGLSLVGQLEVWVEESGQARAVLTLRDGAALPAAGAQALIPGVSLGPDQDLPGHVEALAAVGALSGGQIAARTVRRHDPTQCGVVRGGATRRRTAAARAEPALADATQAAATQPCGNP